jgi:hypothetical protein
MTLKRGLTILFVLSAFYLTFPMISQAGCTKSCSVNAKAHIIFMMNPKNTMHERDQRRAAVSITSFKAEGYYGGGCNTSVGRQKARKRACKEAKKIAQKAYKGRPEVWKNDICSKKAGTDGKYSLMYFRSTSNNKMQIVPLDEVRWIEILRVDFKALAGDGTTTNSVRKKGEFTLKGDGKKFSCRNGRPVPHGKNAKK